MSEKKEKISFWDKIPFLQKIKNIKHIEFILLGIFAIILIFVYSTTLKSKTSKTDSVTEFSADEYANYLEDKLAGILSNISGAGTVKVMITLDGGMKYEYATENQEITTSNEVGGNINTKITKSEEVVLVTINGKSTPLVIKETYPDICGVVVVASGASNALVKLNMMRSITTLLNIKESCIQIMVGG